MFICLGDRLRSHAKKNPDSKYLELRPEPQELDHFPGFGAGAGTVGTSNSQPEPERFHGAGARAVQNCPGSASASQILAMQYHPCGLQSSWLGTLPTAQRPPCQSVLSVASRTVNQARGTHKDDREIAQWIPSSGVPSMRAFRVCPVPWICNIHAIT